MSEAADAASTKVPRNLYKYRSLAGAGRDFARSLLVEQKVYFSPPVLLNDPFDCQPFVGTAASNTEWQSYLARITSKYGGDEVRAGIESMRLEADAAARARILALSYALTIEQVGVFSLSARAQDLLMWSHYADAHRGICVRFDMVGLLNLAVKPLPVTYTSSRPLVDPVCDLPEQMMIKALLTKGTAWQYEQEWRMIQPGAQGPVSFIPPVISAVILGAQISQADRDEVLTWVREAARPVELFQARLDEQKYGLDFELVA